jgi:hypothetical protein
LDCKFRLLGPEKPLGARERHGRCFRIELTRFFIVGRGTRRLPLTVEHRPSEQVSLRIVAVGMNRRVKVSEGTVELVLFHPRRAAHAKSVDIVRIESNRRRQVGDRGVKLSARRTEKSTHFGSRLIASSWSTSARSRCLRCAREGLRDGPELVPFSARKRSKTVPKTVPKSASRNIDDGLE